MGRVRAFEIPGCECWFHTGDHGPPHFHAGAPDEWEIRVFFMQKPVTFEEKYTVRRIPGRVLRSILDAAEEHRVELFRQWEESRADE